VVERVLASAIFTTHMISPKSSKQSIVFWRYFYVTNMKINFVQGGPKKVEKLVLSVLYALIPVKMGHFWPTK
jgi:hypothetical protein